MAKYFRSRKDRRKNYSIFPAVLFYIYTASVEKKSQPSLVKKEEITTVSEARFAVKIRCTNWERVYSKYM